MSTVATNVAARLGTVIGAVRVNGDSESCATFAVDGVIPSVVVKPVSSFEVVEIVRFAKSEKLALIPCGRRTKLGIGMPPTHYDIALDMTGLNQIVYYDPGDLTLGVDAGMNLTELAEALALQQQFVPLAVPFFDECTVGGTIASNIGSSLRPGYGSSRDFLLGAEFVNGAGTFTKSGGRVVKNVTGYDLHKLLIGSLGTLGAITRLNFRTFPLPEGYGHVVSSFSSVDSIVRFQAMVSKSPLTYARARIERDYQRSLPSRVAREIMYRRLLPYPKRIAAVARGLRFYQRSGLQSLARSTGILKLLGLGKRERLLPRVDSNFFYDHLGKHFRPPAKDGRGWHFLRVV